MDILKQHLNHKYYYNHFINETFCLDKEFNHLRMNFNKYQIKLMNVS